MFIGHPWHLKNPARPFQGLAKSPFVYGSTWDVPARGSSVPFAEPVFTRPPVPWGRSTGTPAEKSLVSHERERLGTRSCLEPLEGLAFFDWFFVLEGKHA